MDKLFPIYTEETECQDCYKCVRHCPVKAVRVRNGHASVASERCVLCGECVRICPANAKRIRDDLGRLRLLFENGRKVYVSLAPSWISEFPDWNEGRMVAAFRRMGFAGVGETALGAREVTRSVVEILRGEKEGLFISSACPAAVSFISKSLPEGRGEIMSVMSPVLAHCVQLRHEFGDDIAVVMVSPCVAKKREADKKGELLNLALTFDDLRKLFDEFHLFPGAVEVTPDDHFVPVSAGFETIYPVEGGMIDSMLETGGGVENVKRMVVSGIADIERVLRGMDGLKFTGKMFVETLACRGGCVNGPCSKRVESELVGVERIRARAEEALEKTSPFGVNRLEDTKLFGTGDEMLDELNEETFVEDADIKSSLAKVGKRSVKDELNCGGCGYDSCQNFAKALHLGMAEPAMCVSYLRKQAQKKANALIRCVPAGVVIVDQRLEIVECNRLFASMFDEDTMLAYEAKPGLAGAALKRIVDFTDLFECSLRSGEDVRREYFRNGDRLLNITIFNIEPGMVVGAIIFDVTKTQMRRELIAKRASEVIDKNLSTVQEIAYKLGEHMAETEILLRSISEDYSEFKTLEDVSIS